MPDLEINDLASIGVVQDEPGYMLPPEAWTTVLNMHAVDDGMKPVEGWSQVFGTPAITPHFALPIVSSAQAYWLYTSLTGGAVWDGAAHTDITRVSGPYNAGETRNWNGTILAGIPILNNGVDVPQYWSAFNPATKLADLSNWPATYRAKVLRAFGAYLIAIYITKGSDVYPHLVKWSSEAPGAGALPASWDETDETNDNGEYDLPDVNSGVLHEAMALGSKMMLYKEQSTWAMRFVGGRAVFAFDTFSDNIGILAPRCVALTGDGKKHVVATQDDIVIHNGSSDPASVLNKRMRKTVFSNIDTENFHNSFMQTDVANDEITFYYPESGATNPTRGLVFNYKSGALTEVDGITYCNSAVGQLEEASDELWSDGTDTWEEDTGPWSIQERRKLVACAPDSGKFLKLNAGIFTRDGVSYATTLQRVGLSLIGKKRTGELIVDHEIFKFVDRLWPKVQGGPILIRVGSQSVVDGSVTWGPYQTFDPATSVTSDHTVSGRAIAVEFTMPVAGDWRLDGYKISIAVDGQF